LKLPDAGRDEPRFVKPMVESLLHQVYLSRMSSTANKTTIRANEEMSQASAFLLSVSFDFVLSTGGFFFALMPINLSLSKLWVCILIVTVYLTGCNRLPEVRSARASRIRAVPCSFFLPPDALNCSIEQTRRTE
jgi:hypothetical protein